MRKLLSLLALVSLIGIIVLNCGKKEEYKTEPAVEEPAATAAEDTITFEDTSSVVDTLMTEDTTSGHGGH